MREVMLALVALAGGPVAAWAQVRTAEEANPDCAKVLAELPGKFTGTCTTLSALLTTSILDKIRNSDEAPAVTPRLVQSVRSEGATATGTPAQAEAVPSIQPTAVAAASLAAAGTDSGSKTIAAISLNPATLFGGTDTATVAKWSRVGDFTLLVPLSKESPGVADVVGLRYLGVRGRLNLTGITAGDGLLDEMDEAFRDVLRQDQALFETVRGALLALPNEAAMRQCADALLDGEVGAAPPACKGNVRIDVSRATFNALLDKVRLVREKADARYFGLDLRLDVGDPTLGADPDNDVTAFSFGLAYGQRFLRAHASDVTSAVRLRLAARYTDPKHVPDGVLWAVEGGGGLELSRLLQSDQFAQFSAGLDFRYSGSDEVVRDRLQPNFLAARGGLTVPLVGGASISLGLNAPLTGDVSPSLTANINWGLLLSSGSTMDRGR